MTSHGEIQKILKLQSKIDAKEVKISGLVHKLKKEEAEKEFLKRLLAAAQNKASEKWRIPVYWSPYHQNSRSREHQLIAKSQKKAVVFVLVRRWDVVCVDGMFLLASPVLCALCALVLPVSCVWSCVLWPHASYLVLLIFCELKYFDIMFCDIMQHIYYL